MHAITARLIESMNPHWDDLAKDWGYEYDPEPAADQMEIPRPAGETAGLRDDAHVMEPKADWES
jgi:hypothetical protein